MIRFFIDTNVILDWLIPTNAFHTEATALIKECFSGNAVASVSSHSLTDIFYIARKYFTVEDRRRFLLLIISNFQVISETKADFQSVLNAAEFSDIEDGLQIKCAEKEKLDFIVTENLKDFTDSKVSAISISAALSKLSINSAKSDKL